MGAVPRIVAIANLPSGQQVFEVRSDVFLACSGCGRSLRVGDRFVRAAAQIRCASCEPALTRLPPA